MRVSEEGFRGCCDRYQRRPFYDSIMDDRLRKKMLVFKYRHIINEVI